MTFAAAGRTATAKTGNGTGSYTCAGTNADEPVHQTADKGGNVDHVHGRTDQSTVQSGVYEYDPYGAAQTVTSGTTATENPDRFAGGTHDRTTGYLKYGQRWYDPTTGRFCTQDPLTFLADPAHRLVGAGLAAIDDCGS